MQESTNETPENGTPFMGNLIHCSVGEATFVVMQGKVTRERNPFGIDQLFRMYSSQLTIYIVFYFLFPRYLTVVCSNSTMAFRTKKNIVILNVVIWLLSGIVNIYTALIHEVTSIGE